MSDVTIRVPQDIVQALRLPSDAVAVELHRERGGWLSTSGASCREGVALAGMNRGNERNNLGYGEFPGIETLHVLDLREYQPSTLNRN